jgi:hypothetical protein
MSGTVGSRSTSRLRTNHDDGDSPSSQILFVLNSPVNSEKHFIASGFGKS